MPRVSTKFTVEGLAPEQDWAWHMAGEGVHREFWRRVVELVKEAKDKELRAGLDRFGRALIPITEYTRQHRYSEMTPNADPNAPPLQPGHGLSRTRAWFEGRAFATHAEFFWRKAWGRILHFHRVGARTGKVRDVIGISPGSMAFVRGNMARWWLEKKRKLAPAGMGKTLTFTPPAVAERKAYRGQRVKLPTGQVKTEPPPKIARVGSFDFDRYTFGSGASRETVERAAEAGYFTGFRRLGWKAGGGGAGGGVRRKPAPIGGGNRAAARKAKPRKKVARGD